MQARVWCLLGDIYSEKKDHEQAFAYYDKAIQHQPEGASTPVFIFKKARLHERLQQYEQAKQCYDDVCALFPKSVFYQTAVKHASRLDTLIKNRQ